jgi:predicted PurR-regulated permease PerM
MRRNHDDAGRPDRAARRHMGLLDDRRGADADQDSDRPVDFAAEKAADQAADREDDEPVAAAEEVAARIGTPDQPLGRPGRPMNSRSPFFVGLTGAIGVAVAYGLFQVVAVTRSVLILILLSLVMAIGLNPAVEWLTRRRMPRWAAVTTVLFVAFAIVAGFLAAAVPPLVSQTSHLVARLPSLWHSLSDHNSFLGRLNDQFHLQQRLTSLLGQQSGSLLQGVFGVGQMVIGVLGSLLTVVVLTIYFLADLPRLRRTIYRLVPASRRPRAILLGDSIGSSIGGFVLGNLLTSGVAGVLSFVWMVAFGIPYPVLLALFVAIMDLVPVVGSTLAGVAMVLAAWSVSLTVAIATIAYILVYRFAEDYLLVPRIIGRTVRLPAVATFVAVLVGGVLLGVIGALLAIPVAAAVRLLLVEVLFPRQDRH